MIALKDALTILLALYGAALSTFNFVHGLRRDKRQVKVTASTVMYGFAGGQTGPAMMALTVVNIGHRPVKVNAPALRLDDGRTIVAFQADGFSDFPMQLDDGASGSTRTRYRDIAEALASSGFGGTVNVTPFCTDSAGNEFKAKPWTVDVQEWLRM